MKPCVPDQLPLNNLDWEKLVSLIGSANAALARYDGMLQFIPNPAVLLSPLITQEAVLSSRIEGTVTTLAEVLEYEASEEIDPEKRDDARETLNYRRAMNSAVKSALGTLAERGISLHMIRQIHEILMDSVRGQEKNPGQFREKQNWIGPKNSAIEEARFVPPSPMLLGQCLDNFENYLRFQDMDRMVQLAIAHAQFEIIHPFDDGNGRVGRILIPLFLYQKEVLSSPNFYISAYLERHKDEYNDHLLGITEKGDWMGWITFFLNALIEQAKENTNTVKEVIALYERMKSQIAELTRSRFSPQALDALFSFPVFRSTDFAERSGIPKASALRIIHALHEGGVLKLLRPGQGRRSAIYAFPELISITEGRDVV